MTTSITGQLESRLGTGNSSAMPDVHAEGPLPCSVQSPLLLRSRLSRYPVALPLFSRSLELRQGLHFTLLFQTMDPAVESYGRNPMRLTPIEVCQSALAARSDQPELFLRTCTFPAHFRSLHVLLFLRHRVSLASVILTPASLYVSTCLVGALTEYLCMMDEKYGAKAALSL